MNTSYSKKDNSYKNNYRNNLTGPRHTIFKDDDMEDDMNDVNVVDEIPLYVMAYNLYLKFIKEGGDCEVNVSSKTRAHLHYFFYPSNIFKDHIDQNGTILGPDGLYNNQYYKPTPDDPPIGPPNKNGAISPKSALGNLNQNNTTSTNTNNNNNKNNTENKDNLEDSGLYELLKERENPNNNRSYTHLYKLYHIFDGAWAEMFHLLLNNVYPRFGWSDSFKEIEDKLRKDLKDETPFLKRLISMETNEWFETVKPRSLIIVGVDKIPVDEQISYFGKPFERM